MIAMPLFPEEQWYLSMVKKYAVDGRYTNEEKIEEELTKYDVLLSSVISEKDFEPDNLRKTLFEKLILASYDELEKLEIRLRPIAETVFFEMKKTSSGEYKRVIKLEWEKIYKLYDKLVNRGVNTKMIQKYGIKCCPYCNENYIFNRRISSGKKYAMAQLDHYYSRDKFPIFSVSLYNLVPSCSSCNHIKSANDIGISPHNRKYDFSKMHISYLPNSGDYINDEKEIEIEFQYDNEESDFPELMEKNLDAMGIKEAYNMHKDYLLEILRKGQIYSAEQRESIMQDFPDLFSSDEELIRTIFGNYIREEELLKRPLSKLTRDILEELGLISNI